MALKVEILTKIFEHCHGLLLWCFWRKQSIISLNPRNESMEGWINHKALFVGNQKIIALHQGEQNNAEQNLAPF